MECHGERSRMENVMENKTSLLSEQAFHAARIVLFLIVWIGFSVLGTFLFLRPSESVLEKRELQKFPEFHIADFLDGNYFSDISLWYSDTFPFRENLLAAQAKVEQLYGIRTNTIHGTVAGADEIPSGGMDFEEETTPDPNGSDPNDSNPNGSNPNDSNPNDSNPNDSNPNDSNPDDSNPNGSESDPFESEPSADIGEKIGAIWIDGNVGYPIYYFSLENTNLYLSTMHEAGSLLGDLANVYVIAAPTHFGYLDNATIEKIGGSKQKDALDYIHASLENTNVISVPVYDVMAEHKEEYIYFNTDHHWTALGAYYAYTAFAKAKGITPHSLSDFETMEFDGFVGTLYSSNGTLIPALKNNPDTIVAYVPMGTNIMHVTQKDGTQYRWNVIHDVSGYAAGMKYSTFSAGDNPYSYIENPEITDGSSCLVVKESYANAFIPFLVDHYQTVHIVDYRYYKGNIADFVKENGIQDVIFLNNLEAINAKGNVSLMKAVLEIE